VNEAHSANVASMNLAEEHKEAYRKVHDLITEANAIVEQMGDDSPLRLIAQVTLRDDTHTSGVCAFIASPDDVEKLVTHAYRSVKPTDRRNIIMSLACLEMNDAADTLSSESDDDDAAEAIEANKN